MKRRTLSAEIVRRHPKWCIAPAVAILAASLSAAMAQSTLRFVDAGAAPAPSEPTALVPTASGNQPNSPTLRFVDSGPYATAGTSAAPAVARSPERPRVASTLTLAPIKPPISAATSPATGSAWDLRFVAEPQRAVSETTQHANVQPVPPARIAVQDHSPVATELFSSMPQTFSEDVAPREATPPRSFPIAALPGVELQPLSVQPERVATPAPPIAAPAGTELFANVAPRHLDLPALDYGLALKHAEPPKPAVAVAKPVEPKRVSATPIAPAESMELFAAGTPQPPREVSLPPAAELDFSHVRMPPRQSQQVFAAAPSAPVSQPAPAPVAVPRKQLVPAAASPIVATKPPISHAPPSVAVARPSRATVPAPVAVAAPAPIAPVKPGPIVAARPAEITAEPATIFAAQPAPMSAPIAPSAEPVPPNPYKFHFAATTDIAPSATLTSAAPATLANMTNTSEAVLPEGVPAPCACDGSTCGSDCPYGCGQSGTRVICGVDCGQGGAPCCSTWSDSQCIPWSLFGPGEYVGPARPEHVSTYYLRVNDFISLTFIESRKKSAEHYRIGVGDRLQIEWLQGAANAETPLNRELLVQPDGTVTLPLVGEVNAAGKTINDFRDEVVKLYGKFQRDPQITVTPMTVNVGIQDLLKAVTPKSSSSGQTQDLRVTPEGTIQAAGIGSVYVQGLTLDELQNELEARYAAAYGPGLNVSPALTERAASYVFLGGEVRTPGRYALEGPTTVMQAIALAGGWNIGGNVRQVVIFRRDENWCLKATKIDVRAPLYGQDPCPVNDVWLRENDLVLVPKSRILCATDVINLYFTRGVYAVFPINYVYDFSQNSGIVPIP